MSTYDRMRIDEWRSEEQKGALILDDEKAGLAIRRLAREHKLAPDVEVIEALDDPMLRIRYIARRATHDRVVELLTWALCGRRHTRLEHVVTRVSAAEARKCAAREVAAREGEIEAFRERVRRGSKLIPWVCQCAGVTVQVSYRAKFDATCNRCGERYFAKYLPPTMDLGAVVASEEAAPF